MLIFAEFVSEKIEFQDAAKLCSTSLGLEAQERESEYQESYFVIGRGLDDRCRIQPNFEEEYEGDEQVLYTLDEKYSPGAVIVYVRTADPASRILAFFLDRPELFTLREPMTVYRGRERIYEGYPPIPEDVLRG